VASKARQRSVAASAAAFTKPESKPEVTSKFKAHQAYTFNVLQESPSFEPDDQYLLVFNAAKMIEAHVNYLEVQLTRWKHL